MIRASVDRPQLEAVTFVLLALSRGMPETKAGRVSSYAFAFRRRSISLCFLPFAHSSLLVTRHSYFRASGFQLFVTCLQPSLFAAHCTLHYSKVINVQVCVWRKKWKWKWFTQSPSFALCRFTLALQLIALSSFRLFLSVCLSVFLFRAESEIDSVVQSGWR
mmetsp:Transcript_3371/g.6607  ORF Transcript_3371/g.6607 Transcript_3371/m.6607 type:complete len:162 (-) Transcript_3371:47-532(-)